MSNKSLEAEKVKKIKNLALGHARAWDEVIILELQKAIVKSKLELYGKNSKEYKECKKN
tara:strand:- start:383 stop:559 length:177 start_codon:yes stop_codon:yes gene_type:complete